jgi:hypothetical protein
MVEGRLPKRAMKWMPKQKRARGRPKKTRMEGIKKAMNERNLSEGQWKDRNKWSLGVGQCRKRFETHIHTYMWTNWLATANLVFPLLQLRLTSVNVCGSAGFHKYKPVIFFVYKQVLVLKVRRISVMHHALSSRARESGECKEHIVVKKKEKQIRYIRKHVKIKIVLMRQCYF